MLFRSWLNGGFDEGAGSGTDGVLEGYSSEVVVLVASREYVCE